jgi:hypothetical protein
VVDAVDAVDAVDVEVAVEDVAARSIAKLSDQDLAE